MTCRLPNLVDNPSRRYVSPEEFSQFTGLSLATVRRYLKDGKLTFLQPGGRRGRILIPVDALVGPPPDVSGATPVSEPAAGSLPPGGSQTKTARIPGPSPRWTRRCNAPWTEEE
jgi:excisionase family DNA binding protein